MLPLSADAGASVRLFRIGTGGLTGVYYPIGKLIAQGVTGEGNGKVSLPAGEFGVPGYIGVAQNSAGSVENVRTLASGDIEAGLVQADVAWQAYHGGKAFAGNAATRSIRAVAGLYPEKLQIVTRRDAHILSVSDFRGKRISIDEMGSGTLAVMRIVLAAYGLSEADFSPVYLKPVFTQDKMTGGDLQGFAMMAGVPMDAVTRLSDIGLSLVPIAPETAVGIQLQYPYLGPGSIPEGAYAGIPETPTLQVKALLAVSATLDESLVYQVTAALWSQRTRLLMDNGHPQARAITMHAALEGVSIPLHPGAERYYREKGLLK